MPSSLVALKLTIAYVGMRRGQPTGFGPGYWVAPFQHCHHRRFVLRHMRLDADLDGVGPGVGEFAVGTGPADYGVSRRCDETVTNR